MNLWKGLREEVQSRLGQRNYKVSTLADRLKSTGVEAGELVGIDRSTVAWIPGVEIFARRIYPQRHRGFFGEFARRGEGDLGRIGLWPKQWATATMYPDTAKGFHIHPPHIPDGEEPVAWFQKLFLQDPPDYSLRPYDREQWDVMFFVQGAMEMILIDERAGMDRHVMRFVIEGDNQRGRNNVGVVIPAGVAHALRAEGSRDLIMVYGTSTSFEPTFEGRIADSVESAPLPEDWAKYAGI